MVCQIVILSSKCIWYINFRPLVKLLTIYQQETKRLKHKNKNKPMCYTNYFAVNLFWLPISSILSSDGTCMITHQRKVKNFNLLEATMKYNLQLKTMTSGLLCKCLLSKFLECGPPKLPTAWNQEMNSSKIPFYKVINKRRSIFATFILN